MPSSLSIESQLQEPNLDTAIAELLEQSQHLHNTISTLNNTSQRTALLEKRVQQLQEELLLKATCRPIINLTVSVKTRHACQNAS